MKSVSLLNRLSIAFFLGVLLAVILDFTVDAPLWFFWLGLVCLVFFLMRLNSNLSRNLTLLAAYLLGLGWLSFYPLLSEKASALIFPVYLPIEERIEGLRFQIASSLGRDLNEPQSSLALGMLFGSKSQNFDRQLLRDLRTTGTVHLVAVSGFNVSILLGILLNTSILLVSKVFVVVGLLALVFYTLIVGFSASVLRALFMGLYLFAAQIFGRQKSLFDAFIFTGSLLLLFNPGFLLDLGYQLSFLSMLGVVALSPIFERALVRLPRKISTVVGATLGAQIMILPVSAYNFGQISLIAPLANLLTFFLVTPIMLLSSLELLGSLSWAPLGQVFSLANGLLLTFFVGVVENLAKWPWAAVTF